MVRIPGGAAKTQSGDCLDKSSASKQRTPLCTKSTTPPQLRQKAGQTDNLPYSTATEGFHHKQLALEYLHIETSAAGIDVYLRRVSPTQAAHLFTQSDLSHCTTNMPSAEQNYPFLNFLMMRRATPDSEAVASSEDERPWPMATTFGSLPRKENGVPGLGGGIWSSSQSRGSFKLGEQARRNAAREARMGAPNNASARPANTPSPATSSDHGANSLPFAIPLQPTPKLGRSLSHSQGQREMPASSTGSTQQASTGIERPAALPLGLLNEEVEDGDAESDHESDLGGMLTQTVSHPVFSNLHRTSTLPTQYDSPFSAASNPRRSDTFDGSGFDRRYEAEFGDVGFGDLGELHSTCQSTHW